VEVRELAKGTLSSILHGSGNFSDLLRNVVEMSRTPVKGKRNAEMDPTSLANNIVTRHAGVLGVSAAVLSSPYDIPQWMPETLSELSTHMNDPTPIKESVRATFAEFWRTHLDEWEINFKPKFSEKQLDYVLETKHTREMSWKCREHP